MYRPSAICWLPWPSAIRRNTSCSRRVKGSSNKRVSRVLCVAGARNNWLSCSRICKGACRPSWRLTWGVSNWRMGSARARHSGCSSWPSPSVQAICSTCSRQPSAASRRPWSWCKVACSMFKSNCRRRLPSAVAWANSVWTMCWAALRWPRWRCTQAYANHSSGSSAVS
ncbi:hypothetical protein D3C76_1128610 [compost metagenome]